MTRDDDWRECRFSFDRSIAIKVNEIMTAYQKGDWQVVFGMMNYLERCKVVDQPILAIKNFIINECKGEVPEDWRGYRTLADPSLHNK